MGLILSLMVIFILFRTAYEIRKQRKQQEQQKEAQQLARKDISRQLVDLIHRDFNKIGWTEWDRSVHEAAGQEDRLRWAVYSPCKVLSYDSKTGVAVIEGRELYSTSGHECSCPDFRCRKQPCKHMYTLAIQLNEGLDESVIEK